jgi:hypothetical protein
VLLNLPHPPVNSVSDRALHSLFLHRRTAHAFPFEPSHLRKDRLLERTAVRASSVYRGVERRLESRQRALRATSKAI